MTDESKGVMDVEQIVPPPRNEDPQDVMEDDESANPGGNKGSTDPELLTRPTTPTTTPTTTNIFRFCQTDAESRCNLRGGAN